MGAKARQPVLLGAPVTRLSIGTDYVSEDFITQNGRLGRSHGCPAVPKEIAAPLIDSIKGNQYLFSYYPDNDWLENSPFLSCHRQLTGH